MTDKDFVTKNKIFAVVRTDSPEAALTAAEAVISGGLKLVEITLTTPDAIEVIKKLSSTSEVWIGAGSVNTAEQAKEAVSAGVKFIVSPICEEKIIRTAKKASVFIASGGLTPTEVWQAHSLGADLVKVFPVGSMGGPDYIRYLKGPMPELNILASGGVTPKNMISYLQSGVKAVGLSTSLIEPEALASKQIDKIAHTARSVVKTLQSYLWLKT